MDSVCTCIIKPGKEKHKRTARGEMQAVFPRFFRKARVISAKSSFSFPANYAMIAGYTKGVMTCMDMKTRIAELITAVMAENWPEAQGLPAAGEIRGLLISQGIQGEKKVI